MSPTHDMTLPGDLPPVQLRTSSLRQSGRHTSAVGRNRPTLQDAPERSPDAGNPNAADGPPEEWWRADRAPVAASAGSEAPFWALMAFTFILVVAPQNFLPALAPLRIALLAAAAALATYALDRFARRLPLDLVTRKTRIGACLAAWAVLSVPFSYWPGGSLSFLLDVYFKTLAVFWLLCNVVDRVTRLRRLIWGLSLMSIPLAATAVRHFASGELLASPRPPAVKRILGYVAPLTSNPNDLALLLNLILPLTVALLLAKPRPAAQALLLGIVALDAIAVVLTFSRAGFLTLAATSLIFVSRLARGPRRAGALAACVLLLLSVPLLPSGYTAHLRTITDIQTDATGSAQERWRDMGAAARFALEHPVLGVGPGMNALAMNEERGPTWRNVHNVYLEHAVDLGLPGLALFLLLLSGAIRSARAARKLAVERGLSGELAPMAEGIEIGLLGFALAALFHPVSYQFYFYYLAALAIAADAIARRMAGAPPSR